MNIEHRKFKLIQRLLNIKDMKLLDRLESLISNPSSTNHSLQPHQDSATDLPTPKLRKDKIKKNKKSKASKKKMVFTLKELIAGN